MTESLQRVCALAAYVEVLEAVGIVGQRPGASEAYGLQISNVTDDSRSACPGTLFVCKGAAFRREYLVQAIEAGAVAYVSERDYGVAVPCVLVSDIRAALGVLADAAYDHPSGRVRVCAFTGTKGKTTSVYYLRGILAEHARLRGVPAPALLTGVEYDDGVEQGESKLTTPESFELERRIAHAASAGCEHLAMEASSQALKYQRTRGVEFAVGAFTNFGEDHISPIEHPTLEDYFASKLKLFAQSHIGVVNLDMEVSERVLEEAHRCCPGGVVTYALDDVRADVYAEALVHTERGIVVTVRTPRFVREVLVPTPARFNISNALGAIACAEALGIEEEAVARGFERVRVPGRMELYPSHDGMILGVVDFAHNGMSVETMLRDLRAGYPERELVVVFGATGDKGIDRRETMGAAAGAYADRIVITEDDPGTESAADIAATIARFVEAQGNHAWKIELDRERAIRLAVCETTRPAVVIVTGKGHETRMMRAQGAEPCEADGVLLARALADRAAGTL